MQLDYKTSLKFLSETAHLCGVNIFDPNYKYNVHTIWAITLLTMGHLSTFYSIIDSWPDMDEIVKTVSTFGICVQVFRNKNKYLQINDNFWNQITVKFCAFALGHKKFQKIFIRANALHENFDQYSADKQKEITNCFNLIKKIAIFLWVMFSLAIFMFWLNPIYTYYFQHKRELMFGIRVPFVDHTSISGYTITMIMQLVFEVYAVIGMSCNDSISMMLFFYTIGFNGLLSVDLKEFGEYLQKDDQKSNSEIKKRLHGIIEQHQQFIL